MHAQSTWPSVLRSVGRKIRPAASKINDKKHFCSLCCTIRSSNNRDPVINGKLNSSVLSRGINCDEQEHDFLHKGRQYYHQRRFQSGQSHALKRDWTDLPFQEGYAKNQEILKELEDELRGRYLGKCTNSADFAKSESILPTCLENTEALGAFLDLCGAYIKNYEIDKSDDLMEAIMPACEVHSGLFIMKALNHLSTIRMKQGLPAETLEILERMEALIPFAPSEAWELFVTLYRNRGWALSALNRTQEALSYFNKLAELKSEVGEELSWFEYWDLGRTNAAIAVEAKDYKALQKANEQVAEALRMHWEADGDDLVMRAKILHNLGETHLALDLYAPPTTNVPGCDEESDNSCITTTDEERRKNEDSSRTNTKASSSSSSAINKPKPASSQKELALECFLQAHALFSDTEGRYNPLTGGEAEACAAVLCQLGRFEEAKTYLYTALKAISIRQSGWGSDTKSLASTCLVLDNIIAAHRDTEDREGLIQYQDLIKDMLQQAQSRASQNADSWERLISSATMVLVASGSEEGLALAKTVLCTYGNHLSDNHLLQPLRTLLSHE